MKSFLKFLQEVFQKYKALLLEALVNVRSILLSVVDIEGVKLFSTGFTQVFLIAINTYFISKTFFIGVALVAFLISFVWCFNVGKVSTGTLRDKIIYSLGASIGSISGLYISQIII